MAQIAKSAMVDHKFDDKTPSITLDEMCPDDLAVLTMDKTQLDFLHVKLLPDYGISASDILEVYPTTWLQTSLLPAGPVIEDAYIVCEVWNLPLGMHSNKVQEGSMPSSAIPVAWCSA
ncbi:hypothetical protein K439DRAFT_1623637 [Ramaria rubella]|nr:hypothetical protein K439DRAFT_1623637 [Ramaria rubella]